MILKGNSRKHGALLASHLLNAFDNERVEVHEVRGTVADDLHGSFAEMEAIASATKCTRPLYHLSINPPAGLSRAQYLEAIEKIERGLGLEGRQRAVVFHEKDGREHAHVVWSRIDTGHMRAAQMSFDRQRLRLLARELCRDYGFEIPEGLKQDRGAARFAHQKAAASHAEQQQAARTGMSKDERKAQLGELYRASDTGQAFVSALEAEGYVLAQGQRRAFVLVDLHGDVHSLSRHLEGVSPKTLKAFLAPVTPESLPDVAQAREQAAQRRQAIEDRQREQAHAPAPAPVPPEPEPEKAPEPPAPPSPPPLPPVSAPPQLQPQPPPGPPPPEPRPKLEQQPEQEQVRARLLRQAMLERQAARRAALMEKWDRLKDRQAKEREVLHERHEAHRQHVERQRQAERGKVWRRLVSAVPGMAGRERARESREDAARERLNAIERHELARRHANESLPFRRKLLGLERLARREADSLKIRIEAARRARFDDLYRPRRALALTPRGRRAVPEKAQHRHTSPHKPPAERSDRDEARTFGQLGGIGEALKEAGMDWPERGGSLSEAAREAGYGWGRGDDYSHDHDRGPGGRDGGHERSRDRDPGQGGGT